MAGHAVISRIRSAKAVANPKKPLPLGPGVSPSTSVVAVDASYNLAFFAYIRAPCRYDA